MPSIEPFHGLVSSRAMTKLRMENLYSTKMEFFRLHAVILSRLSLLIIGQCVRSMRRRLVGKTEETRNKIVIRPFAVAGKFYDDIMRQQRRNGLATAGDQ